MNIENRGVEGISPTFYFTHDAGIWRHVSDLFDPKWFQLLMKGNGGGSITTVEEWGKWLADSKNYGSYQGQNTGRVVFEKLVSEGYAPNLQRGTLSSSGIDQFVDYITKSGEKIQLKHSLGEYVQKEIYLGKYSPANGVDGVAVNTESYRKIISNPGKYGFTETSPGSGIAVHGEHGTRVIDSGMNSDTSRNILLKAQDYARDNQKALDITEHLGINALKAMAIAAAISFAIKGSINMYRFANGTMRCDDAVDNTVNCTIRAAMTGGITTFVAGGIMAAIGIPTAGLGLVVAIPVGVTTGLAVNKVINTTFDNVYWNLMGGRYIAAARENNIALNAMFTNLEQQFTIAELCQEELERKASKIKKIPWTEFETTISMGRNQINETKDFLKNR